MNTVFKEHQRIAKRALKMNPLFAELLGGMTVKEAEEFLKKDKEERQWKSATYNKGE